MRVKYLGARDTGSESMRFALVSWDDPKDDKKAETLLYRMYDIGWYFDLFDLCAYFPVNDREEYDNFIEDWKEEKAKLKAEMKKHQINY